jgi:hypothetical protein
MNSILFSTLFIISHYYVVFANSVDRNADLTENINTQFSITQETEELFEKANISKPTLIKEEDNNNNSEVKNFVSLYAIHSSRDLKWDRPSDLITSVVRSMRKSKNHFMGHLAVHASCTNSLGKRVEFYTGMTTQRSRNIKEIWDLQKNGYGLMMLLSPNLGRSEQEYEYNRHLQRVSNILPEFSPEGLSLHPDQSARNKLLKHKTGNDKRQLRFIAFEVDEQTCDLVENYYATYRGYQLDTVYGGLISDPLKGQGGGCANYGISFLKILNVLNPQMDEEFSRSLNLPSKLIGKPLNTNNSVGLLKLLFYRGKWAESKDDGTTIRFYEPNKVYNWIKKTTTDKPEEYHIAKFGNALGIIHKSKLQRQLPNQYFTSIDQNNSIEVGLSKAAYDIFNINKTTSLMDRFIKRELKSSPEVLQNVPSYLIPIKN